MFNLIWKDFQVLKRTLWFSPIYGFLGLFAFSFTMKGAALSFMTIMVTYMLMDRACDLDARNNSEIILNSLPLSRLDIVLAKYLSVFPYAAVAILSFVFAQEVVFVTGIPVLGGSPISKISLEGFAGALIAMVAFISFYYPIYFKLGYARIKWAGMVLVLSLMFFIPITGSILAGEFGMVNNPILLNIIAILERLGNWQQTQADWQIASYLLICALILMATSVSLSLRFYCRREF